MTQIIAVRQSPQRVSTAVQQKRTVVIQQSSLPPAPAVSRSVVIREPPKRISVQTRQLQRVSIALPGARGRPGDKGEKGDKGDPGPTGPPSIYVGDEAPLNPVYNTLWLDTA